MRAFVALEQQICSVATSGYSQRGFKRVNLSRVCHVLYFLLILYSRHLFDFLIWAVEVDCFLYRMCVGFIEFIFTVIKILLLCVFVLYDNLGVTFPLLCFLVKPTQILFF